MAFALSIIKVEEALKQSGCPACRIGHEAGIKILDTFLWENVNEPDVRQPIIDARGFCPQHTRMLVADELSTSSLALGVNIIYDQLARQAAAALRAYRPVNHTWWSRLLARLRRQPAAGPYAPIDECPACKMVAKNWSNTLSVLFEELEAPHPGLWSAYLASDGLCLTHLRQGLVEFGGRHPRAARRLCEHTASRLEAQSTGMKEYIRKTNWSNQDEPMTPEERLAWVRALTFFTGLPAERFSFRIEEF